MFDQLYAMKKTPEEEAHSLRFTTADYRRFCAIFFLQTQRLLKDAVFIMEREKKKRIMPRHLLTAAVLNGLVPRSMINHMLSAAK